VYIYVAIHAPLSINQRTLCATLQEAALCAAQQAATKGRAAGDPVNMLQ
jgi:hypothetical protein